MLLDFCCYAGLVYRMFLSMAVFMISLHLIDIIIVNYRLFHRLHQINVVLIVSGFVKYMFSAKSAILVFACRHWL